VLDRVNKPLLKPGEELVTSRTNNGYNTRHVLKVVVIISVFALIAVATTRSRTQAANESKNRENPSANVPIVRSSLL
jgi:hypothetical protein